MEGQTQKPRIILICCEGKKTEPQYFKALMKARRIGTGSVKVEIVPGAGKQHQHKELINKSLVICDELRKKQNIEKDETIEIWAVCDKDQMNCSLKELEEYAKKCRVNLAFTDPQFEIVLLQHLCFSSTNSSKGKLEDLLSKKMRERSKNFVAARNKIKNLQYKKNNLQFFENLFDEDRHVVEQAIENCRKLENRDNTPYTTAHNLLIRLLEFEVKV